MFSFQAYIVTTFSRAEQCLFRKHSDVTFPTPLSSYPIQRGQHVGGHFESAPATNGTAMKCP